MSDLTDAIDQLAVTCCSKMSPVEQGQFLAYQQSMQAAGLCVKKRYNPGTTYYKGKRKGKMRDVFEIDGEMFNQLWIKLYPYVATSITNSHLATDSDDAACIASEVKCLTFRTLRFFGGAPYGKRFSDCYRTIVRNVLTNEAGQRGRTLYRSGQLKDLMIQNAHLTQLAFVEQFHIHPNTWSRLHKRYETEILRSKKKKGLPTQIVAESFTPVDGTGHNSRTWYAATSMSAPIGQGEDGDVTLEDILPHTHLMNTIDLTLDIPVELRKPVELLIGGLSVAEVARKRGYRTPAGVQKFRSLLREKLAPVLQEYYPNLNL